uniref:Toll-like receptor 23f n=1 Tax=Boleophthalmus pectinirostris TaxID=150288 RepID=A0A482ID72_BOLPE|nr:toll-like receptor 23f [Boleophthalmus pectinirostris]
MWPASTSLLSLLFLLLLSRPSLFYSLRNCTIDFHDSSKVKCDFSRLHTIPRGIPKTVTYLSAFRNRIVTIRESDFKGFTKLEALFLGQNDMEHIENGAFSDLSALTQLNLKSNSLTELTDNMFEGLTNLRILNLYNNKIDHISPLAFKPLGKLQELYLASNELVNSSNVVNIVSHCPSLKILDLTDIRLTVFETDFFPFPLQNLTKLHLGSDTLTKFRVHSDVFPQLESLTVASRKRGFEWDVIDKVLTNLKTFGIQLSELKFETCKKIFQSFASLENLHLSSFDEIFDERVFDFVCGIPSLQKFHVSQIHIFVINDTLLQSCSRLTDLKLIYIVLGNLSESALQTMTLLRNLNIEQNVLSRIPPAIQNMSTLTHLSFQSNLILKLQCSDFLNLQSLTELNLNHNQISTFKSCVFKDLTNLKVLFIEHNLISQLDHTSAISLPSLKMLSVSENNLILIEKDTFSNVSSLTELNLKSKSATEVKNGAFEGLVGLKRMTFSLNYHSGSVFEGLPQLQHLVVYVWNNMEITELSEHRPLHLEALQELSIQVDKNACVYHALYILHGLKKLQVFSLDTVCCSTPSGIFWETPNLVNLKIINCAEFSPNPELFQPIAGLKILNLSNNKMKYLDFLTEANLTKLEMMILTNNDLTVINETVFEALPSLKYLDLYENPFVCDCSNAGFIDWVIRNKQVQVVRAYQYRCSSPPSEQGHFLLDFNVQSCWESTGFLCFISSSALVLVTLLSSFIYHFLRWQLVYGFHLFLAFLYDSKKRRQGCPHIYDAFVSYNVHDEDWVYGELLPELEEVQGWRLCLHHRDFQLGKPIIENITDAIYSSRKTLCVISRRYLQSEWCSREIQMASYRLFDEQKDVLILLFLEEISSNHLSPFYRMRKLVKSRTYLSWTQARSHKGLFWENVRRALECDNEPADSHNPLTVNV